MEAKTVDLVHAAKSLIQNDCVGDNTTAALLDLPLGSQVSTCVCWGVFEGLRVAIAKREKGHGCGIMCRMGRWEV
jgi:hypothetical protein